MKKIIASVSFLLIAFISCDKKDENAVFHNDLQIYNLNGKVKSVQEKSYEIVGGDAKGNLKRENSATFDIDLEFDQNKQLIAEKSYNSAGKLINSKTFEYKDRMISEQEFLPNDMNYTTKFTFDGNNNTIISKRDKNGLQIHRTVNTFEKGVLTQKRIFDTNDKLVEHYKYKYDKKGDLIEATKLNEYETLYTDVYAYDNKKNKVSEARLDNLGKRLYKNVMTYKDSLITSTTTLNAEDKPISVEKKSYDSKGKLVNKSFEDEETKEYTKEAFRYDTAGNLLEWELYSGTQKTQSFNYKYDSHNNLIHQERKDQNGSVLENKKYTYEYDEQGNWITKNIINNDMPVYVIERKINYY